MSSIRQRRGVEERATGAPPDDGDHKTVPMEVLEQRLIRSEFEQGRLS